MLTTDFVTGSPNWIDLGSPDTGAAAAFYGAVFGWEFESAGPHTGGYGFFTRQGRPVAALGPLTEEGARSAWTVYFHSEDAEATTKLTEQHGGTVRVAPGDVMDQGRLAGLTDPSGAEFALWQPGATRGLAETSTEHTLLWVELHTTDPAAAVDFYRAVLGWVAKPFSDPTMGYTVLAPGERPEEAFGGITQHGAEHGSSWNPYFAASDVAAVADRVLAAGGTVPMPPTDIPGVGRMCWLTDPFGADFAVLRGDPSH